MPRDIPVGNGTLLVAFDQDYCLRDIYYPWVGKEDHAGGHRFRFGIWAEGVMGHGPEYFIRRTDNIWNKYDLTDFYYCIEGIPKE